MSAPPYMPLFVGDYLADTTHLTCTEHGAYMLLLMAMWRSGGALPNDDAKLARFARCTRAQWDRIRPTLLEFFDATDAELTQGRMARELTKHSSAVEQRRMAGSNGGKAKALKDKATPLAGAMPSPCQPEPEPDTTEANASAVAVALAPRRAAGLKSKRMPDAWMPLPGDQDMAAGEGFTPGEIERELSKMRDHQFRDAHCDWSAVFRNWIRRASESRSHERPNQPSAKLQQRHANYERAFRGAQNAARARTEHA